MKTEELIILIFTGGVAGWLAALILKRSGGFGVLGNVAIGVIGAFIGGWIFSQLDIRFAEKWIGSLVTATFGAILLLLIGGLLQRKR